MISIAEAAAPVIDHLRRMLELRERLAELDSGRPPRDVPPRRWRTLIADSRRFFADDPGWGLLALDFGWSPHQLLGANRVKPHARIDQCGLLWLINAARIEELGESHCALVMATGVRSTYRVRPVVLDETCLPWELGQ
jgi:hypothetical protein